MQLAIVILLALILLTLNQIRKIMATIEERFAAVNTRLDEASTEIIALIGQLRDQGVTPAAEAILQQIEAKANALADIVPNP